MRRVDSIQIQRRNSSTAVNLLQVDYHEENEARDDSNNGKTAGKEGRQQVPYSAVWGKFKTAN